MSLSHVTHFDTTYAIKVDEVSNVLTYIGEATIGASETLTLWRIRRLQTSGTVLSIAWADGNQKFDNIWADRVSLSYT